MTTNDRAVEVIGEDLHKVNGPSCGAECLIDARGIVECLERAGLVIVEKGSVPELEQVGWQLSGTTDDEYNGLHTHDKFFWHVNQENCVPVYVKRGEA